MQTQFTETEKGIFDAILEGKLDLESGQWASISDNAKDLLRRMLTRDPRKRITADEALRKLTKLPSSSGTNTDIHIFSVKISRNRTSLAEECRGSI